jgi:hypothetical protein
MKAAFVPCATMAVERYEGMKVGTEGFPPSPYYAEASRDYGEVLLILSKS